MDLLALGAESWAFEIKSHADSLKRLPVQVEAYSALFDRCVAVVADSHLERALEIVPAWWGVIDVRRRPSVQLEWCRPAQINPEVDVAGLIRMLWRDESVQLLTALGLPIPPSASRQRLWALALQLGDPARIGSLIKQRLRERDLGAAQLITRQVSEHRELGG